MAELVKVLVGTDKAVTDVVAAVLILIGGLLIMGALVFRVFIQPEWTFEQAVSALWPFFAAGSVSVMLGWLVDRADGALAARRARRPAAASRDARLMS